VSADITFFESISYFSSQVSVTISKTITLSSTVPLPIPVSTVSLPVSPVETQDPPATKPVRDFRYVYTHRPKFPASEPVPAIPSQVDSSPPSASLSDLDILIALRKDKWPYTDHPILNFVSYDRFNLTFYHFVLLLSSESIPRFYTEFLLVPVWKHAMNEEMKALTFRETWELVSTPTDSVVVGCRWFFP